MSKTYLKTFQLLIHLADIFYWVVGLLSHYFLPFADAKKGKFYQSRKNSSTEAWERLAINKTVPTPCDRELWMFTFGPDVNTTKTYNKTQKLRGCRW